MPRTVTVQFDDGSSHVYQGVPDTATPEQVEQRAATDFAGKRVKALDGGASAAAAPTSSSQAAAPGFGRGGRAPTPETLAAMRDNTLTRTVEGAVADPVGTLQAGAAGVNRGFANLAGLPADTAANIIDLLGAGYGTVASLVTGKRPDEFYQLYDRSQLPGTGENIAGLLDKGSEALGQLPVTQNPRPDNPAARLAFTVGQSIPGAATVRGLASNASAGAAQNVVAEAGGDEAAQIAASIAGGRAGQGRTPRQPAPTAPQRTPTPPATETPPAPLTASGQPRTLPQVPKPQTPAPAPPLTATGAPRAAAYTDLEGAATSRKAPRFVEETPTADGGQRLGLGDQARRKDILRRVGVGELRHSAIQGDAKAASTDFQMSKLDSPQGQHMARVLNAEREAIGAFAERLAEETGGTRGTGQTENLQRGTNIVAPLDGIKEFFDTRTRQLYKLADQRAKGRPFDTAKVREIVGDESEFLGTVEGEALLRGVRARMKSLGMTAPDGTPQRTTVAQAERLKQWLGEQWTPRTSRLVKRLKEGVDDDVLVAAGEDVYKRARALRAERARILDDPQGIARIMDAEGPQGINRAVAVERIGDVVTTLPVAQFSHIVKTLNEAPAELRDPAQAALAEIKSQFANKLVEIGNKTQGQWNARGVSKYLNDNSARLRVVFTPAELRRFADLNDAGHILRFDSSYPGAAVQAANLKRAAVADYGATAAGTAIGSAFGPMGGVVGAGVGKLIGGNMAKRLNESAGLKAAQKRTTDLRLENALGSPDETPPTNALRRGS